MSKYGSRTTKIQKRGKEEKGSARLNKLIIDRPCSRDDQNTRQPLLLPREAKLALPHLSVFAGGSEVARKSTERCQVALKVA